MDRISIRLPAHLTNKVLEIIKLKGFPPSSFKWVEVKSRRSDDINVPQLNYLSSGERPGNFYFTFDWLGANFWIELSPAPPDEVIVKGRGPQPDRLMARENAIQGDRVVLQLLSDWLDALKREVQTPDLWLSISKEAALFNAASSSDYENTLFTIEEKQHIAASLSEIKEYLFQTHDVAREKQEFIENRLSYLEQATERLGRFDWLNVAVGVLTNIVVGIALNPDSVRETFRIAGFLLNKLFGGQKFLP